MLPLHVAAHQRNCSQGVYLAHDSTGQGCGHKWFVGKPAVSSPGLSVSEEGDSGDLTPKLKSL